MCVLDHILPFCLVPTLRRRTGRKILLHLLLLGGAPSYYGTGQELAFSLAKTPLLD